MVFRSANTAQSEAWALEKGPKTVSTVRSTILEALDIPDVLIYGLDSLGATAVVGAVVIPVLGVNSGTAAFRPTASIALPNLSFDEPIAVPRCSS